MARRDERTNDEQPCDQKCQLHNVSTPAKDTMSELYFSWDVVAEAHVGVVDGSAGNVITANSPSFKLRFTAVWA